VIGQIRSEYAMKSQRWILLFSLLLSVAISSAVADSAATRGFIYGTVTTTGDNSYTGVMRWGTEELFWDDLFNSTKGDLPYLEEYAKEERRSRVKILGITVGYRWDDSAANRMFIARFGDIDRIDVGRGERVTVTMRDGQVFDMKGGSNDIGAQITVWDEALGKLDLQWGRIDSIQFKATPSDAEVPGSRLYGDLESEVGSFSGYVQWDSQESISSDKLDGSTDDGDLEIDMGGIRSIARHSSSASAVELKDGRELKLRGTNDVNESIRGIFIEDKRYGRVKVNWDSFERLVFKDAPDSGRGYDAFKGSGPLRGTVLDVDGQSHSGRMIFDLDETAGWELLNGNDEEVEFYVPFSMIASVTPERRDGSTVKLRGGQELLLTEGKDVGESNSGVVVLDGDSEEFFPWSEVKRVEFK